MAFLCSKGVSSLVFPFLSVLIKIVQTVRQLYSRQTVWVHDRNSMLRTHTSILRVCWYFLLMTQQLLHCGACSYCSHPPTNPERAKGNKWPLGGILHPLTHFFSRCHWYCSSFHVLKMVGLSQKQQSGRQSGWHHVLVNLCWNHLNHTSQTSMNEVFQIKFSLDHMCNWEEYRNDLGNWIMNPPREGTHHHTQERVEKWHHSRNGSSCGCMGSIWVCARGSSSTLAQGTGELLWDVMTLPGMLG